MVCEVRHMKLFDYPFVYISCAAITTKAGHIGTTRNYH
jgi:hypothetical protein